MSSILYSHDIMHPPPLSNSRTFPSHQVETLPPWAGISHLHRPLAMTNVPSVSMDFSVLDVYMQVKTPGGYHFTPVRMPIIISKRLKVGVGEDADIVEPSCMGGIWVQQPLWKNGLTVLKKVKCRVIIWPSSSTPKNVPKKNEKGVYAKACISVFTAALLNTWHLRNTLKSEAANNCI